MLRDKIRADIEQVMKTLGFIFNDRYTVEEPKNPEHGDFSTNIAMVTCKLNKMRPIDLAEKIAAAFSRKRDYKSVEIAGAGFINFTMSNYVFHQLMPVLMYSDYGTSTYGEKKKVILEFVSANPTGPLNVVSARASAYGDTLFRVMQYIGFEPFREYYVNDAGNQVDILAESVELRYRELHGEKIREFPAEAYNGEYIKDIAAHLNAIDGSKLLHYSEKDRLERMKNFALDEIHNMQVSSLDNFGVDFENWMSEQKLRQEGSIEEVLSYLSEANVTYEKDDAIWFESTKFGDEKDRVLMRADGTITYIVPDIAYHLTKYQRGFDIIIDVLGPDHHGYVPRLMAALEALNYDKDKLEIVFLQHINLLSNGEMVKMSKRTGRIVTMQELIDDVGKDAARYFFLDRKPNSHLNFDFSLAKKASAENPVYYIQYAHARICSVMVKAKKAKMSLDNFDLKSLKKLDKKEEIKLIKKMLSFTDVLILIADKREPHRLASYTLELAGMFHKYYNAHKIINPRYEDISRCRIFLISCIKNILGISLELMGISAPTSMKKKSKK
ncbi:MAG: arginine--tRNA ligase [Candidatus Cloacimonetes bacterium]|nr:arginine--tRNA ligase [Candidatus Cloacimonadota bacterium]